MTRYVVLGAGPIGCAVTSRLLADGHTVTVVTRSGTAVPGAEAVAMAGDDPALSGVLAGAAGVVIATNPPYHRWRAEWPPLLHNVIAAAEVSGSDVVLIGNLYGYPPGVLMTASEPLGPVTRKGSVRTALWEELLAAHRAGRVRATEIRASDYTGPEALATDGAHAGRRLVTPVLKGRTASVFGQPDAPHSWAAVGDIAATVTAALGSDQAWGRPWVVPTVEPRSLREIASAIAVAAGAPAPRLKRMPDALLLVGALFSPMVRELREMRSQHDAPFICDGAETTELLGVPATPWPETTASMVAAACVPQPAPTARV
jgi:nucleoside-diphosphate-sugar epimerase